MMFFRYITEYQKVLASKRYKKDLSKYYRLMKNLTVLTGREISDSKSMYFLHHTFTSQQAMNLTLPEWSKPYFPVGPLTDATLFHYDVQSYTPLLKKINGGNYNI